jgi:hypothetical protein
MEGYHDDTIMSCAMALWAIEYSFKSLERLEKQTKAMLGSWVAGSPTATVTDIERGNGFVLLLVKHRRITKPKFSPLVSKNMQDPTGKYMWLFSGSK